MTWPPLTLLDGSNLVVSPSQLALMQRCPRQWGFKYLHRREPAGRSVSAAAGKAFHAALEPRNRHKGPLTPAVEEEMRQKLVDGFQGLEIPDDEYRNLGRYQRVLDAYNVHWRDEEIETLAVEVPIMVPVGDIHLPYESPFGALESNDVRCQRTVHLHLKGIVDRLVRHRHHGLVLVGDTKTTKDWRASNQVMWERASAPKAYCYTPDTEVLTPTGWKKIPDLLPDDKVMQWEHGCLSFVTPKAYVKRHFNGKLIGFRGRNVDLLTTPEHRHVVQKPDKTYVEFTADSVPQLKRHPCWFVNHGCKIDGSRTYSDAFLKYLVALQADGRARGNTAEFRFKKARKIERFRSILHALSYKATESTNKEGVTRFSIKTDAIFHKDALDLMGLDKEWGRWLLDLDGYALNVIVNELPHWDGSVSKRGRGPMYFTTSRNNADWMMTIAHLCGFRTSMHTQTPEGGLTVFRVCFPSERTVTTRFNERYEQSYSGWVYCLSVDSTWLLVRRNGKIVVSGNCWGVMELARLQPDLGLPTQVHGFLLDSVVVRREASTLKRPRKEGIEDQSFQRIIYPYEASHLLEWRRNALALVKSVLLQLVDGDLVMNESACSNFYGRTCSYLDVCNEPDGDGKRELILGFDKFTDYKPSPFEKVADAVTSEEDSEA